MSIWDDPDMKVTDAYVKFENPGDSVAGTITSVGIHRWEDGTACPKLTIDTGDGDEVGLTAGQVGLKRALAEQRPEVGDHIAVTFTEVEKRPGGKTLKKFDVQVTRGGAVAAPAPAAPAQAAPAAQVQPTAEQMAAIEALKAQGLIPS